MDLPLHSFTESTTHTDLMVVPIYHRLSSTLSRLRRQPNTMRWAVAATLITAIAALGPKPPAGDNTTATIDSNRSSLVEAAYTLTIYNSDCWCRRSRMRFCTWYKRDAVVDGRCYPISHYARSMLAYDPLISMHNRLVCKAWQGLRCDDLGLELGFVDNTRCREPVVGDELKLKYRSFSCHHE
ncbi:hypothetical protein ACCO45_002950 [Purpureocillium lilacinum]|uniref:Uncharacterized protein n=1 Tax=Purpureocillium lilacinum TaxID=33203 RepID=A0ACC4DZT8_PURLI